MTELKRFGTLGDKVFGEGDPFNDITAAGKGNLIVDTMEHLKHPVTGEYFNSKSKYMQECARHNLEVVSDADKFSGKGNAYKDCLPESVVMDRIERAEAICSDPAKFRARQNENLERLERRDRLLNGKG